MYLLRIWMLGFRHNDTQREANQDTVQPVLGALALACHQSSSSEVFPVLEHYKDSGLRAVHCTARE